MACNGTIYGTTYFGGGSDDCYTGGCGTLFSLSVGLAVSIAVTLLGLPLWSAR